MAGPRIVFTRFDASDLAILEPWRAHRDRVIGIAGESVRPERGAASPAVIWQLVAANNRELARGIEIRDTYEDAVISASEAVQLSAGDGVVLISDPLTGEYGWFIRVLGRPAVVCGRWYLAERERRHALRLTLESMPRARLAPSARQYIGRDRALARALA